LSQESAFTLWLLENVADGVVACDADGRLTQCNQAAREWLGADLVGLSLDEWANHHNLCRDDGTTPLPAAESPIVRASQGETLTAESVAVVIPGKPTRFLHISGGPLRDREGRKLGAMVTMCDVTKLRPLAERTAELEETNRNLKDELEALQREKEQAGNERALLRCILDSANDLIFIKDQNSVYRGCNRASEQFLGLSESDQIGKTDYDFFDAEAVVSIHAADRQVMETGKPVRSEELVTYADGHKALMDTVKVPYHGPSGELLGLVGIARDITERRQAEEALRASEAKYMDLYENAPDMYASVNAKTALIEECNQTLANSLGYTKAEIIRQPVFDLYHPDCLEGKKNALKLFTETGEIHEAELQLRKKDGSKLNVSLNASAVRGDDGQILFSRSTLRDITERKQAEEKMLRSDQRLRLHSEQSPLGFLEWDDNFHAVEWNAACERIFGYTKEEAIGRHAKDLILPVEVHKLVDDIYQSLMNQTGGQHSINENITKDGRIIICEWFNTTLIDRQGSAIGVASVCRDITQQKQMEAELSRHREYLEKEVKKRTAALEAANKELEAFAYSVSHDLRTPLRHIAGFVDLLKKRTGTTLDQQSRHYMQTISDATHKMGLLIDDMLSFSRMGRQAISLQQVALGPMVREVIDALTPDTNDRDIDWCIGDPLPAVDGDASMLRIVLVNLISNSLKFTRHRKRAQIEIGSLPGKVDEVEIYVRDDGVGFDMTYADNLFGVFQRLHRAEEFEGTGIGLATVRRIIARHGGRTWAEGRPDQGASFYFALPRKLQGE
jgi:PAS domain S-box-containing protein